MAETLPSFPVDDVTIDALEHALGAAIAYVNDEPTLVGADYDFDQLLDFLSGYDPSKLAHLHDNVYEYQGGPLYTWQDVVTALIAEVRRLRLGEEVVDDATDG